MKVLPFVNIKEFADSALTNVPDGEKLCDFIEKNTNPKYWSKVMDLILKFDEKSTD